MAESPGSSALAPWLLSCPISAVSADWFSRHHCISQQRKSPHITGSNIVLGLSADLVVAKKANNEQKKSPRPLLLSCLSPHSKAKVMMVLRTRDRLLLTSSLALDHPLSRKPEQ